MLPSPPVLCFLFLKMGTSLCVVLTGPGICSIHQTGLELAEILLPRCASPDHSYWCFFPTTDPISELMALHSPFSEAPLSSLTLDSFLWVLWTRPVNSEDQEGQVKKALPSSTLILVPSCLGRGLGHMSSPALQGQLLLLSSSLDIVEHVGPGSGCPQTQNESHTTGSPVAMQVALPLLCPL